MKRMTAEQEKTFVADFELFRTKKLGIRALRQKYGKRTVAAFRVKACRLRKVNHTSAVKKIPNLYLGVARRLQARGLSSEDIHEVIFGPKVEVKLPLNTIRVMENLLNLKGKMDIRFRVEGTKILLSELAR